MDINDNSCGETGREMHCAPVSVNQGRSRRNMPALGVAAS